MTSGRSKQAAAVVSVLAAVCPCAFGLNPALDINQYAHQAWTVREGFFKGTIYAIAQMQDGYLWMGTEFGLARFDGVRSLEWQPPNGEYLPGGRIRSLLAGRDGRLWIGTDEGLASWKDGKLTHYPELAGKSVLSILQDHEATVWAAGWGGASTDGRLCTIRDGRVECYGNDGSLGNGMDALYEDRAGKLWAGSFDGVWLWKPGPPKFFPMKIFTSSFAESQDGELLTTTLDGIRKFAHEQPGPYLLRAAGQNSKFGQLLRDRDGGLWVGTYDGGLLHIYRGRTHRFTHADGLSGDSIRYLFEDREGSIWVGTRDGLDRFREFAIPALTEKQGLSNSYVGSILYARDGSIWLGTLNGLDRWKNGEVSVYGTRDGIPDPYVLSLFEDQAGRIWITTQRGMVYFERGRFVPVPHFRAGAVVCMAGDGAGGIWISEQQSLFHLEGQTVVEEIPWTKLGHQDYARTLLPDPARGGLWLGFHQGGVAYYKDHSIRLSYGREQGFGEGEVSGLQLDEDGSIWAATGGGLNLIRNGQTLRLSSANGLPCDIVHWVQEDNDHFFWLYTACGLLRIARPELEKWAADPQRIVNTRVWDNADGVRSNLTGTDSTPIVAKSADGKIWFLPRDGVSVIDPRHLAENNIPPPVHIEEIVADDKTLWQNLTPAPAGNPRLPSLTHRLQIRYTALSFVAPEKIHFKYKLEGYDRGWMEAVNKRDVEYTNLPPRKYRFRVMASNNSGVWNETGDRLEFSVAPAFYQTNWFLAACMATFAALLWAAYQIRTRQLQRESRRFREVIETIPAMAWVARPDGSNEFVNRRWAEYTGLSAEETAGSGWTAVIHPDDLQPFSEKWRAAVASGQPLESEVRFRCSATREYRCFHARGVPLRDKHVRIRRWYGILTDIEDRKRAEQERERLRQLESDLAHINRVSMMGELAASIAHEVNQPLTGIVSNGSACLRWLGPDGPIPAADAEEIREAVGDMVRDGKRAGEIITRIRALTKRTAPPREKLDLNETVREVLALVGDEAKKNGVRVRTQFADEVSPVHGDRVQLQQVLLNLVMNAIQALSGVSDRERQLAITTRNIDQDQVQVTVEDSGTGLDPGKIAKIFEPFFTTKSSGMGMGLSICRSILQNHGGKLWATANEGAGASFHFTLPKSKGEETNAGAAAD